MFALDGVFDLGLSAVLGAFHTANELAEMSDLSGDRFDVKIVGVTRSVKTAQGLNVPVQTVGSKAPDCVVVPAIGFKMPKRLESALGRPDVRDAGVVLRHWARKGAMMTAACIGTFVMAESVLLDHQRATTTWWLVPPFRRRYPSVSLELPPSTESACPVKNRASSLHSSAQTSAISPRVPWRPIGVHPDSAHCFIAS